MQDNKTIYALATPLGGAIAVIRISGNDTHGILSRIFTGHISHRMISHGLISDGENALDDIMAVYFKSPHSYTGEDMAELYIHGSRVVAKNIFMLLSENGASPAEPGEFTRRAFLNGKMQLSDAEAVMDLINASAQRSASSAMLQLSGKTSERINSICSEITDVLAEINAAIDYPDEMEDIDPVPQIKPILHEVDSLLRNGMLSRHLREGFNIAIAGRPNVGKSSLLNALIDEDRAIVTDIAGTTRDIIEADAEFCGIPVHLYDTAGLHSTNDKVERIGIERAKEIIKTADFIYVVLDASSGLQREDIKLLNDTANFQRAILLNKCDIAADITSYNGIEYLPISAATGEGIDTLKALTADIICPTDENGLITNSRHIEALANAKFALKDAIAAAELDAMAQDLHIAIHALGLITGDSVDEKVISRIFERFCVGK